jgi:hypothetical protein
VSVCGVEFAAVRGRISIWVQKVVWATGGRDVNWDEVPDVCFGERAVFFDVVNK